jgi:hypothetical protein
MIGGIAGEFRNTGSAAASSAWACLLHFFLVLARVLIGAVGLIPIGAGFSATPQSLAGPDKPVGTILAVRLPNKGWSHPVLSVHGELAKRVHTAATASSFRRAEQLPASCAASTAQPGFRRAAASA